MKRFLAKVPWRCERVATRSGGGRWPDALARQQLNRDENLPIC
jgi:hypothetical protein